MMDFYTEIKIKGFYHFNDPEAFSYLKWYYKIPKVKYESVYYPFCYYPIGRILIRLTQRKLQKKYMNLKAKIGNCDAWTGVDLGTDNWHNDSIEGSNTAFLMYFSDMDESTGGGIQFKSKDSDEIYTIYPKKYDIIIMDQDDKFLHRVIPLNKPINRNIANIEFNILEA